MLREILKRSQLPAEEGKLLVGRSIPLEPVIVPAQEATPDDTVEQEELDGGSRHSRSKRGQVKKGQV